MYLFFNLRMQMFDNVYNILHLYAKHKIGIHHHLQRICTISEVFQIIVFFIIRLNKFPAPNVIRG